MLQSLNEVLGLLSGVAGVATASFGLYNWFTRREAARSAPADSPARARRTRPADPAVELAREAVRAPALALMAVGVFACGMGFIGSVVGLMAPELERAIPAETEGRRRGAARELPPAAEKMPPGMYKIVAAIYGLVGLSGVVAVAGSVAMLHMKPHILAVAGSVAVMCNLVCCYAGIPIGLWCLWTLYRANVRPAFD